ncbi:MAG: hypothetical protein E7075_01140 [Bacteroidales bacterium]|nr:hypothetical protein [Bacteroidales bacterium]
MKKILVLMLPILALIGCGNSYTYNGFTVESYDVHIDASDWQYTDYTSNGTPFANNYFYCRRNMPQITSSVFNDGEVQAYIVYDKHSSLAFKHLLPYVRHYEELLANGTWNYYTETVDCVYGVGWVEFNYRASDFAYEDNVNINPNDMDFTIVLTTKN